MHRATRTVVSAVLLGLLAAMGACSDNSEELEQIVVDIEGNWMLNASLAQDQGDMVCEISDLHLIIEMDGFTQRFGGRTSGGLLSCSGGESPVEVQLPVLSIGTGLQDKGSEVTFNLSEDGQAFDGTNTFLELEGDLSSVRMEGEMRGFILLEELGQVPAFKGSFTNVRTSI